MKPPVMGMGETSRTGLPMVGSVTQLETEEIKLLNNDKPLGRPKQQDKTQNKNLPMKEKQNTNGTPKGLPMVGYARISLDDLVN